MLNGGYLSIRTRAVKSHETRSAHTGLIDRPLDGASLEALNWIQKTRWTMNRSVLGVVEEIVASRRGLAGIPDADNLAMPDKVDDAIFEAMDKETKSLYLRERGKVYSINKQMEGERFKLYRMLDLGRQLAKVPVLWFPHTCDFRGRVYPTAQDLHTQGDSLTKGLLTFAESERLGPNGRWWLYVACANAFGNDKVSLDARASWTDDNLASIIGTSKDPLAYQDFWAGPDVDSPWEALSLCFEIGRLCDFLVINGERSVAAFESHIPVRLDATCSGIQHLSAMMKDPLSARAVNVDPTGKREDIYGDVAKVAVARIMADATNGALRDGDEAAQTRFRLANGWMDKVARKTVKRAVMTTPYGVTAPGIKTQLIADGFCDHFENGAERYRAAEYLKDVVVTALDANIGAPRAAMEYFQSVAQHLSALDKPMTWTTPAGFTVRQAYAKQRFTRIDTLLGSKRVQFQSAVADESLGIDKRKQKSSAAPNVVHSYDAAHLCLTAVAMKAEGIRDMAFVHDSFGTHAGHVDTLSHHIRNEFVRMYEGNALAEWRESIAHHSGVADLPAIPTLGSLDVTRVMESEFFFS